MIGFALLFKRQIQREILIHLRQPRLLLYSALFFLMVAVFFPLTMPPDVSIMRTIAPGLVWIAILLALLLSSAGFFQQDYENGVLEQWLISGYPLSLILGAKLLVHWLLGLLPMLLFCPLLALLFNLTFYETIILIISLIAGTPAILFLCGLAASFSAGRGVLMALILLPLTVPVMVFGSGTLTAAMQGLPVQGYLAILAALSILACGFLPFATAAVIRISLTD
ncbi:MULTISPECIES: heme exporter protein CcmB [unclassified Legionella]|uniref:heme exporter protein CcmB n=1 Tax=unclassified Legionella TaxID=2622702 RepID=UPI001056AB69|nr:MULTISPECIES: heme exporter protein CcmB [unclassified Legionella]MDI9818583.1 heme exporter protein CcmB [Legionella sp. PL877]